jgi:1-acyl-sn-glycerol-3-phosphate acyltransferase
MRRVGALLALPADVLSALRAGELVLVSAAGTSHARHAGAVPQELVGQAVIAHVPVLPVATISSRFGRTAHVSVGPPVDPRHERKGPLAHIELAEQVQHRLQRMLDNDDDGGV